MEDPYSLLFFHSSIHPQLQNRASSCSNDIKRMIESNHEIPLTELLSIDVKSSDKEIKSYYHYLVINRLLTEEPRGLLDSGVIMSILESAKNLMPEHKASIANFAGEWITKEIRACKDPTNFIEWVKIFKSLAGSVELNAENLQNTAFEYFSPLIMKLIENAYQNPSYDDLGYLAHICIEATKAGLKIQTYINLAANAICNKIESKNCLGEISDESQADRNLGKSRKILGMVKSFVINNEIFASKRDDLVTKVGVAVESQQINPKISIEHVDLSQVKGISIKDKRENEDYSMDIQKVTICDFTYALKIYEIKTRDRATISKLQEMIDTEIKILSELSSLANIDNCFLKFEKAQQTSNKHYICMEYVPENLTKRIKNKESEIFGTPEKFAENVYYLISSFEIMARRQIYHKDIKPDNIMVTGDNKLKIIDFNASEKKIIAEDSQISTQFNRVVGTRGFMAPELEEAKKQGKDIEKFRVQTSDVFSLGMTIMQMKIHEDLFGLNYNTPEAQEQRLNKIKSIPLQWVKNLLYDMLSNEPRKRKQFVELLRHVPWNKNTSNI